MKSIRNESAAHCPSGCEPFDVEYWSLIRADQNPDLKESILGGELNLVRCPECGTYFHHDEDLLYLDIPAELLVFVFSKKTQASSPDLRARIESDFGIIKNTLLKDAHLDFPPISVFGLEELKPILQHEQELVDESEVVAAAAAAAGFSVARLKPSYAREHHFPFYVPAPVQASCANDYAVAAAEVLKTGLNSKLLLHFKDKMAEQNAQLPPVL